MHDHNTACSPKKKNAAGSKVTLGKERVARRNIPRGGADRGRRMRATVFGRLSFEKEQAPPSRFRCQFLEDSNDFRRFVCEAEEGERAAEDARTAAGSLGIDLPREKPS